jgi:energy-coupling factor transport system permease protein
MVLAALRFLPMLREEASDVLCAAQMRGLQIKKASLRRKAGAYVSIVLPVVAGAIQRAELLSIAMEARGFRAFPRRTSMRRLQLRVADWAYLAVFCLALAALLFFA